MSSAPLRISSAALRISRPGLPQIPRSQVSSAAPARSHHSQNSPGPHGLASRLEQRTYSTSASTEPQASTTESTNGVAPLEKPDFLNDAESAIWDLLVAEFAPTELIVQDVSGGCGSMYGIEISSEKFRGLSVLKQQRMVNAVLGDLLKNWHGVQLKTHVP
ncbi:bola-like protein [Coniochaeta ligniaria NRRL 30616]|uniref:Bola-like protein n=1 Tax=Coniochaeta ligniaria NRRL 30616 TaxID=1408157 RepID=A0A1J7JHL7_9PEZI|nr:bola-like protein [Coniochaeta ligniaria NRRL 30616]